MHFIFSLICFSVEYIALWRNFERMCFSWGRPFHANLAIGAPLVGYCDQCLRPSKLPFSNCLGISLCASKLCLKFFYFWLLGSPLSWECTFFLFLEDIYLLILESTLIGEGAGGGEGENLQQTLICVGLNLTTMRTLRTWCEPKSGVRRLTEPPRRPLNFLLLKTAYVMKIFKVEL